MVFPKFILYFIAICFISESVNSARILGVVPTPSYSHQIVFQPLWKEFLKRGHEVVVFTTNPFKDPSLKNLTEIDWSYAYQIWKNGALDTLINHSDGYEKVTNTLRMFGKLLDYELIEHPSFKKMLNDPKEHFDLVIVEYFYPMLGALAHRFNCPYIGMSSMDLPDLVYDDVGLPVHPVLHPFMLLPYIRSNSYFERLLSTAVHYIMRVVIYLYQQLIEDYKVKEIFGNDAPSIAEIRSNVSMLFINTNLALFDVRAVVPAFVQIGGNFHMKPLEPLPKEIQLFLDDAHEGAIYFSLGTNVELKYVNNETMNVIMETFKELPYKVLWKVDDNFPSSTDKILTSTWFPQQDILRHPNVKLFITQGGLQSLEEALYTKVPIIGIPFFADQKHNIERVVLKGMGLYLDHKGLEKHIFKGTIQEVITDKRYRNNIEKLLQIALDQPMTGLEKAVWWSEYLIRHKSAKHLQDQSLKLPLYQYYCLDVIALIFTCLFILITIIYKTSKYLHFLIIGKSM